jgi:hypothetical protein
MEQRLGPKEKQSPPGWEEPPIWLLPDLEKQEATEVLPCNGDAQQVGFGQQGSTANGFTTWMHWSL